MSEGLNQGIAANVTYMFFTFKFMFSYYTEPKACPDTVPGYGTGGSYKDIGLVAPEGTVKEAVEECMKLVLEQYPDADSLSIDTNQNYCYADFNIQGIAANNDQDAYVMCLIPSKHLVTFYYRE